MNNKQLLLILITIITLLPASNAQQSNRIDPTTTRFISQEAQNTRDYVKQELTTQLKINHDEIQKQVDFNKKIAFKELDQTLKVWGFRFAILWFSSTLLGLLTYRLIMMRITKKYRHVRFRDELLG